MDIDKKITRPKFCFDQTCEIIYSTFNEEQYIEGFSFFCFGKLKQTHIFKEKEVVHDNNLSHCYYTPLKGMIRFFVNQEDLWGEANAKLAVLNRLIDVKCNTCGGKQYKAITHICFDCQTKR